MKISRLKFSKLIIGEMIATVILFFIGMHYWVSGYNNMKYCRNFQQAIDYYSAGRISGIGKGIRKAESTSVYNKVSLYLFKANYFVEQGKYKQALSLYQEIEMMTTCDDSQVNDALVGAAVCKLYLMTKQENLKELENLEKKLEKITKEDCSDAYVVLGQVRLKQAKQFLVTKKYEFMTDSLKKAQFAFEQANKQHAPDNYPLARNSCFSFYIGQALSYKYTADLLLAKEKLGRRIYPQRAEYLHKAAENLRRAQLLRLSNKQNFLAATAALYGELVAISWLDENKRRDYLREIEEYLSHAYSFSLRLAYMQRGDRKQIGEFNSQAQMFFNQGMGAAYFLQGDYSKAIGKILYYYQLEYAGLAHDWKNKKKLGKLTVNDFIIANNYLVLLYRQPRMHAAGIEDVLKILQKTSTKFSSRRFFIFGHKEAITIGKILWHNLYMISSYTKLKNIDKIMGRKPSRYDCLYPQE